MRNLLADLGAWTSLALVGGAILIDRAAGAYRQSTPAAVGVVSIDQAIAVIVDAIVAGRFRVLCNGSANGYRIQELGDLAEIGCKGTVHRRVRYIVALIADVSPAGT